MKNTLTILILVLLCTNLVHAQEIATENVYRKHMIDVELAGSSFPYSIGYNYAINPDLKVRAGFGYMSVSNDSDYLSNIPITADYKLLGSKRSFLILNAGIRFTRLHIDFGDDGNGYFFMSSGLYNKWMINPTLGLGYLYDRDRFSFNLKLSLSHMDLDGLSPIFIAPGLKTGYKF